MYQNILLTTDLTETAKDAAHKAWELASLFDAKLSVIHVIEPIPAYGYPGVTDIESPYIDAAKEQLAKLSDKYIISKENQYVEVGSIKQEVLKLAEKLDIDLIVVGSHSRHGIAKLLGSSANAILHAVNCDIIIVRIK